MLIGLLLTLQIIVSISLVCVVLLQRSEGGGFVGGGSSAGMMSVRGAGDLLTRTTAILATLFMVLSLTLALMNRGTMGAGGHSILDTGPLPVSTPGPAGLPPAGPASSSSAPTGSAPTGSGPTGSAPAGQAPAVPAKPTGPSVPSN